MRKDVPYSASKERHFLIFPLFFIGSAMLIICIHLFLVIPLHDTRRGARVFVPLNPYGVSGHEALYSVSGNTVAVRVRRPATNLVAGAQ